MTNTDDPTITIKYDEYEDMHARIESTDQVLGYATKALVDLIKVCQEVIKHRDDAPDDLQGWITELEENIPCEDCLHAPCCCEPREMR